MNKMISVASGFQYSVNIGYDLGNDGKLQNFIPTQSALSLLEDILCSTYASSTERARVLIGAYGKGKSHIVLMILSMLMKRDLSLFEKTIPKIDENPRLKQCVHNYYESNNKILPVVVAGSNTSLPQAFLLALQRTLSDNDLLDVMPNTNYKAAITVINRWKIEFPETYDRLGSSIDVPIDMLIEELENFNIMAYEQFERIYPSLTAGSSFNPFLGFDVVELYESVAEGLKSHGYTGIYTVYDEFSKFLEASITEASVSDTKMLQDFAEKCNRSGKLQLHLMLISHKEISNYIDKLPQQKVDGWRGVSERFKHIHLNNNFSQTYEIISSVIRKDKTLWKKFVDVHSGDFVGLIQRYTKHMIFSDVGKELTTAIYGCYPLHPISTFILPRLSERIAQNERTLFTFLSAYGNSTLPRFLENTSSNSFKLMTPDMIYDYFEQLFMKEAYTSNIHSIYVLTANILHHIQGNTLGCKIIKTISLIYMLEQYEKIKPTKEEIRGIFSSDYNVQKIEETINDLIANEYVIYLKRSNDFLRLKQTSGVDIKQTIKDRIESQPSQHRAKDTLNAFNFDNYMYPSRYNDEHEMTRFFAFEFIDESEVSADTNWMVKIGNSDADGVIYGILTHCEDSITILRKMLLDTTKGTKRAIFILPKHYKEIEDIIREFNAVVYLRDSAIDDPLLFDEYEVIYEDLNEVISAFVATYTHPEKYKSFYLYNGNISDIKRKASLTELMSDICDEVFCLTPTINNEAVNRNDITGISNNNRSKIITALLRNDLESNLGLTGSGQDVSIMRSTLIRTGVWQENNGLPHLNLCPDDPLITNMLDSIKAFILSAQLTGQAEFSALYHSLTSAEGQIGLRKGLIPIYLAAVIHEFKQQVIIMDRFGPVQTNMDSLAQIDADPDGFRLAYIDWNPEKEVYIKKLALIFSEYIVEAERSINTYDYVAVAMRRWYMSLPKYAKESKATPDGKEIDENYQTMIKLLRLNNNSYELLFSSLPSAFCYNGGISAKFVEDITAAKAFYDRLLDNLKAYLVIETKKLFTLPINKSVYGKMSLSSTINEWCNTLDARVFEQLFPDGTNKCLELFRSITNDDDSFITRLAKLATDLRIEDWDDITLKHFKVALERYKKTSEDFVSDSVPETMQVTNMYQVTFADESGKVVTKRFDKVEYSKRGKLLYNQINASLNAMGRSISEQEKRQILMEVIKSLC